MNDLEDDQARFEVEYHKDPANIDEAVSHVVNYMEARKAPYVYEIADGDRIRKKNVTFEDQDSTDSEDSDTDIRDELRLRFKKREKSVKKVAKTGKHSEKRAKPEHTDNELVVAVEQTGTVTRTLKTQIESFTESKLKAL